MARTRSHLHRARRLLERARISITISALRETIERAARSGASPLHLHDHDDQKDSQGLAALATLAASLSPSRLGTAAPCAASAELAAPGRGQREACAANARLLRRSLRACLAEGLVAELFAACTAGAMLTAWAIYLDASTLVTGALLALSQLAQLFQFPAAWTTSWLGHRRACIVLVGASRQVLLPLALLPFVPLSTEARQTVLLSLAALSAVLGVLGNNAWVAWMSELVPKRIRGRYFGRRTALCTLGGALAAGGAGLLLDRAKASEMTGHALAALQLLGSLCGALTTLLMMRQHDPRPRHVQRPFTWARVATPLRDRAVRGLLGYLATWSFAVGMAGSFFALHMLRNLKMSFALVAAHGTGVALVRMLAAPVWGRLLDRLGARPVLIACSFGISTIPFVWLFASESFLWPLLADCALAGVLWGGHALAAFNLPLAVTPREERPYYLAAFASVAGLSFSAATLAGGLLAEQLPDRVTLLGYTLHDLQLVFACSGFLRLGAAFAALRIHEPSARSLDALWPALGAFVPSPLRLRRPVEPDSRTSRAA